MSSVFIRSIVSSTERSTVDDGTEERKSWRATPYRRRDPASIAPRDFLFGTHFMRGYIGVTAGAGGVSKSMRVLIDAVSLTIGHDLLGRDRISGGRKRVWVLNLEDDRPELERRIEAICKRFSVDDDLAGLYVDSGRDRKLIVAKETQYGIEQDIPDLTSFEVEMQLRRIDVLIVDPFVESHEVKEGLNDSMKTVMGIWRALAHRTGTAIDLTHHIRKNGGAEATIDDVRGGSSMVQAARSVRLLSPMSVDDARSLGIDTKDRRRYVAMFPFGKANFAPPIDQRDWFHLESIALDNGSPTHPDGDRIGVPVPWSPPGPLAGLTIEDCRALRAIAAAQVDPGSTARVHPAAGGWFGRLVAAHLDIDLTATEGPKRIGRILDALMREKWLIEGQARDQKRELKPVFLPYPETMGC